MEFKNLYAKKVPEPVKVELSSLINKANKMRWEDGVKLIPNNYVDLILTDPPYGMSYQSNSRKEKHSKIKDDDNLNWLVGWIKELRRVAKDEAHLYIFCSWHNIDVFKAEFQKHFKVKNILIWEKKGGGMGDLEGDYSPAYELILFCSNGEKILNGKRDRSVIRSSKTLNDLHPTQKPVNLMRYFIEKSSEEGDVVLDTFAGSFPTAKASIETKRKAICFERDEDENGKEIGYCKEAQEIMTEMEKQITLF